MTEVDRVVVLQFTRMGRGSELPVLSRSFRVPILWEVAFDSNVVHEEHCMGDPLAIG